MNELKFSAKDIAIAMHHGQKYGDVPYRYHLEAVVAQVIQSFGCQPHLEDIAWLHDILEDTEMTVEYLMIYDVHPVVIEAVELLTKVKGVSYKDYIGGLVRDRDHGLGLAWKVKVADTLSNLAASVVSDEPKRVMKYSKQLKLLYKGYKYE